MEVDLLDIIISTLQENPKVVEKLERCYDREKTDLDIFAKDHKLNTCDIKDKIKAIIMYKNAADILSMVGDFYPRIKSDVKKGLRFQQTVGKNVKPTNVVKMLAMYKFFELLLDKWQELDDYESLIVALAYHDINKTRLKNFEPDFQLTMISDINQRSMISAFCGSPQLYSYVYGLLLEDNLSMSLLEETKLSSKDYKDINYGIAELMQVNKLLKTTAVKETYLDINLTDIQGDSKQVFILILVGVLVKTFSKIYLQKQEELANTKPEKEIIVKEDLESKRLLSEKQAALNKLQISHDKQKEKIKALSEELDNVKEYVGIIEKIQEMEETQSETAHSVKPTIPYGKGIVLFGGHPNYQRKFAEQYSWVKIIDTEDVHVDWNLVRNATLVLINWKHLSHRQFYKLISLVREHKIEYKYVW